MCLLEPTTKIWMKIDSYYQRQKCRPMTLVPGGISFVRIFTEVPWSSNDSGVVENGKFQRFCWLFFQILERWGQLYYMVTCSLSLAFQWSQNAWPWMTLTGYFTLNSVFAPVWLAETVRLWKRIARKLIFNFLVRHHVILGYCWCECCGELCRLDFTRFSFRYGQRHVRHDSCGRRHTWRCNYTKSLFLGTWFASVHLCM